MPVRASSLSGNTEAIINEINSKYDAVIAVRDKLPQIEYIANLDLDELLNGANIMSMSVYDTNNNGIVDNSEKVGGLDVAAVRGGTTKDDVELGLVDNTSDISKPISTATQNALNVKVDRVVGKGLSTEDYTTVEKSKLDGIASGANNVTNTNQLTNGAGFITSSSNITGNAGTATTLATARNITLSGDVTGMASFNGSADASIVVSVADNSHEHTITNVTGLQSTLDAKVDDSEKGASNGVATLDVNGKVVLTQIPDSVLGQLEYQGVRDFTTLPTATQKGQYWVASVSGNGYVVGDWAVWNGSAFDKIDNTDAVATVAGRTGNVVLTKSDVGLSNVANTADANKNVLSATKLTTARTINGVSFDGTTNIAITDSTKLPVGGKAADSELLDGIDSTDFVRKSVANTVTQDISLYNGTIDTPSIVFVSQVANKNTAMDMYNGTFRIFRNGGTANGRNCLSIGSDDILYHDNGVNGTGRVLTTVSGKAVDSELLDGRDSTQYVWLEKAGGETRQYFMKTETGGFGRLGAFETGAWVNPLDLSDRLYYKGTGLLYVNEKAVDSDKLDGYHSTDFLQAKNLGEVSLDTATTAGMYRFDTGTDSPTGAYNTLLVAKGSAVVGGDANTAGQILFDYDSDNNYIRGGITNTQTWRPWGKILTDINYRDSFGTASVIDYGADPTGTVDSSKAFQDALNANKNVYVPKGTYLINYKVTVNSGNRLYGSFKRLFMSTLAEYPLIKTDVYKPEVVVATTANITLSGIQTIDGFALSAGHGVLVKNQTNQAQNGVWICQAGAWYRYEYTDTAYKISNMIFRVIAGTTNIGKYFKVDSAFFSATSTVGTTNMPFIEVPALVGIGSGAFELGIGAALEGLVFYQKQAVQGTVNWAPASVAQTAVFYGSNGGVSVTSCAFLGYQYMFYSTTNMGQSKFEDISLDCMYGIYSIAGDLPGTTGDADTIYLSNIHMWPFMGAGIAGTYQPNPGLPNYSPGGVNHPELARNCLFRFKTADWLQITNCFSHSVKTFLKSTSQIGGASITGGGYDYECYSGHTSTEIAIDISSISTTEAGGNISIVGTSFNGGHEHIRIEIVPSSNNITDALVSIDACKFSQPTSTCVNVVRGVVTLNDSVFKTYGVGSLRTTQLIGTIGNNANNILVMSNNVFGRTVLTNGIGNYLRWDKGPSATIFATNNINL